ncbi:CocE/NonD family hydrolase [Chryseobacterium chendengshani]|uniref:CocE/NonD family hydrolase n=1 Tax=Chryseobacterium sp. LJ756 TaxID=2864113 RepID=UPI001C6410CB|nr:CocE/NonD family hydrolase [Chryseobacterium sp. LJ756]MBW7675231.1 CocE/NonD family hydrolase [Chryseobacterium sp. LJ756]
MKLYKESDSLKFHDNYMRFQMLDKNYDGALTTLNKFREIYKNSYPDYSRMAGIQFEIFILAKKASKPNEDIKLIYKKILDKKYNELPILSKNLVSGAFKFKDGYNKNEIKKILKDSISQDSISLKNAILLCRHFNYLTVIKETFSTAIPLLKELDKKEFLVKDSVIIKTKKGNEIALYYVLDKKLKHPKPSILNFSTYLRNSDYFISGAKVNADRGYNIIYAFSRGIYLSKDQITPFEFEIEDVNEVINWIIKQPWSDGKVGMIGGSYDGFSQWAATKNLHPALKTIIPSASVGFGIDFPMYNNCFSPYMLRWLSYVKKETDHELFSDEKKWLSVYNSYYKTGVAFNKLDSIYGKTNPIFQKWLKHPSFDSYWHSKLPYKKDFAKINIPVLTLTGYYDADQRGAMYYYDNHIKYNKSANHYLIIGPYSHSGVVSGIEEEYKGYKIDPIAKIDLEDISFQWFDYILKAKKKPEFIKDKVNYQVMGSNQWKSASDIDKISNQKLKLFLNKTTLQESKAALGYISQKIDFLDRKDTMQSFNNEKILDSLISENLKNNLIFESGTFDNPFEINGNFTGNLKVSINKKDMDITLNIYEKLTNGQYLKLSHEYFARASYAKNNTKRDLLKPNSVETIPIKNTFFTSRKIEKGSKLILILGIRKSPDVQINYGTGKDVSEETIADAKEPLEIKWYNDSYIEIPIMAK